jgi:hypothetical protein
MGTTNVIWVELTANSPHAALLIETEIPLSSTGRFGDRFDSEAFALLTVALVTAPKVPCAAANSPAANPEGAVAGLTEGLGDGLGLGDGVGLTLGLGVGVGLVTGTTMKLAPVKSDMPAADSVVTVGTNE